MPRPDVLESYYAGYYSDLDREVTFSNAARFAKHLVDAVPRERSASSTRILDYGGGDGSLSRAVGERWIAGGRAERVDITVVDFLPREPQQSNGIVISFQPPSQPFGKYDLVLASAILEHVPDLHSLLARLYAAIDAGGFFYARTPYAIPLTKLMPRLDLAWPAHVHDLGSPFWNRFRETFSWSARLIATRPSLVAGTFREDPFRTLAAFAMKVPAHIESRLSPGDRVTRCWHFPGGWEVLMQRV